MIVGTITFTRLTPTVEETLYFDYETATLYTDQEFVNKASIDRYGVYHKIVGDGILDIP